MLGGEIILGAGEKITLGAEGEIILGAEGEIILGAGGIETSIFDRGWTFVELRPASSIGVELL